MTVISAKQWYQWRWSFGFY